MEEVFTIDHMPPITPGNLEMFHRKSEAKASKVLSTFLDTSKTKFKNPTQMGRKSRESLAELISETFSHFQRLAHKKRESVKARNNVTKFEEDFREEMEKLLVKSIQTYDLQASKCQNRLRTRLQRTMDVSVLGTQNVQHFMSSWDSRVQELLRLHKVEVWNPAQQRLESAKAQASSRDSAQVEEEYRAEMEKLPDTSADEQTVDLKASNLKERLRK